MTRNVNWPGRGPTWIAVPALVAILLGGLTLLDARRRGLSWWEWYTEARLERTGPQ